MSILVALLIASSLPGQPQAGARCHRAPTQTVCRYGKTQVTFAPAAFLLRYPNGWTTYIPR